MEHVAKSILKELGEILFRYFMLRALFRRRG